MLPLSILMPIPKALEKSHPIDKKEAPCAEVTRFYPLKQNYRNGCGAACLLSIAYALGVKNIPVLPDSRSDESMEYSLKLDSRCQADIYRITSDSDDYEESTLQAAGYSMPHNIVIAAQLMGLTIEVYENPSIFSKVLNWIYPTAREALENEKVTIINSASQLLPGQFEMKALAGTACGIPAGLHWVVALPDGSFMDPAGGMLFENFSQLQSNAGKGALGENPVARFLASNLISYEETGISIVFSNPNA